MGSIAMPETTMLRHRFTVEDYHRMVESGILTEDYRVELLHGEIVLMAPIGSRHMACVNRLIVAFEDLGDRVVKSVQNPVHLADSEPEPDLALLAPRADFYASRVPLPGDVLLLVEVAESSQVKDRDVKAPLYAQNDVPEYWLVDLAADVIEVYRQPEDGRYPDPVRATAGEILRPLAFPEFTVAVDAVLP